jgi:hypothetical protein
MTAGSHRVTARRLDAYRTGTRVVWSQLIPPPPGAPEADWVAFEWPLWCRQMRCVHPVDEVSADVPPLLGWSRAGSLEMFTVGLPGSFSADTPAAPRSVMPEYLRASRGADQVMALEVETGVLRIVLSHFRLPDRLGFDPARIPTDPFEVYVGQLMEGSDMGWDLLAEPHGVIAGRTGSGKSKAADLILAQLHAKGWGLRIITPKRRDPMFTPYAEFPQHRVVTGVRDEDLEAVLEVFRVERVERWERQEIRADHGVDWWHHVPETVRAGRPSTLLVVDEAKSYFWPDKSESRDRQMLKAEVTSLWSERLQEGRSDGQHGLALTQSPYVDTLGGGFAMSQIGFWLVVRKLDRKWLATVFQDSTSEAPRRVLLNPATPPGRGVARGVKTPDNAFGAEAVNDAPVQVAYLDDDQRQALLSGTLKILPRSAPAGSRSGRTGHEATSSGADESSTRVPGPDPARSSGTRPVDPRLVVLWPVVTVLAWLVSGLAASLAASAVGLGWLAWRWGAAVHTLAVCAVPVVVVVCSLVVA